MFFVLLHLVIVNDFNGFLITEKTKYKGKNYHEEHSREDLELPLIDLNEIVKATDNFSLVNKLGEGGFGPVYKVNFQLFSL